MKAKVKSKKAKTTEVLALVKYIVLFVLIVISSLACGSALVENKNTPAKSPTPIPPEAVKVDKPVNVSFSTYSKDWPVGWQWIDPDEKYDPTPHDVHTGVLRVRLTSKKNLNDKLANAPRYLKPISGDFQIETRVKFNPKEVKLRSWAAIYWLGGRSIFKRPSKATLYATPFAGTDISSSDLPSEFAIPTLAK